VNESEQAETLQWCTDMCARCDRINQPFYVARIRSSHVRAEYKCKKCRHRWFTNWELNFAIDHALGVKSERQIR
jgi:DNA-directed RNA polymerase subunit RPC12/RpoP